MLRDGRLVVAAMVAALAVGDAAAVVIPAPPKADQAKPSSGAKRSSPPKPVSAPAPPPVSPLLVRRRGAPPSRAMDSDVIMTRLARGQLWAVTTVGSDASNCNGSLRIAQEERTEVFAGPLNLTCSNAQSTYSFRQDATLMDLGDSVVVSLRAAKGDAQAPNWTQLRLSKEGLGRLSGAAADGPRSTAITLMLSGH